MTSSLHCPEPLQLEGLAPLRRSLGEGGHPDTSISRDRVRATQTHQSAVTAPTRAPALQSAATASRISAEPTVFTSRELSRTGAGGALDRVPQAEAIAASKRYGLTRRLRTVRGPGRPRTPSPRRSPRTNPGRGRGVRQPSRRTTRNAVAARDNHRGEPLGTQPRRATAPARDARPRSCVRRSSVSGVYGILRSRTSPAGPPTSMKMPDRLVTLSTLPT